MKKRFLLGILPLLAFGLVACGNTKPEDNKGNNNGTAQNGENQGGENEGGENQGGENNPGGENQGGENNPGGENQGGDNEGGEGENEGGIQVLLNGNQVNLANLVEEGATDLAYFETALSKDDVVSIEQGETSFKLGGINGQAVEGDVYSFTAPVDATYKFYVNKDGEIWIVYSASSEGNEDAEFTVLVNDDKVELQNLVAVGSSDLAFYQIDLVEEDEVIIKKESTALKIGGVNSQPSEEEAYSFVAPIDATYNFYINQDSEIWITYSIPAEGAVTVDLYTKFEITDDQLSLPTFAYVWSGQEAGTWFVANHIEEAWESTNNRHFTFSMENPVGKNILLAIFNADSGYSAENLPGEGCWDNLVLQSGDATIADWTGGKFGADLYAKQA